MSTRTSLKGSRWQWLYLLVCVVGVYVVVPQLGSFRDSFHHLRNLQIGYIYAAIGFSVLTCVFAATTYYLLALHRLRYPRTLLVQAAATFVNRLLPAGIGAIGANYVYLRKARHSSAQAVAVVAVNNTLGFIGHALLFAILILIVPTGLRSLHLPHLNQTSLMLLGVIIIILLVIVIARTGLRHKLRQGSRAFIKELRNYKRRPAHLLGALLSSLCLTLSNIFCLWFSVLAVHGSLGLVSVLLIFTFGLALGTITPTPGGIGGIEAGLLAGLVAYHLDAGVALAAVLLYRLVSFWLTIAIGSIAFVYAQKRSYL